MLARAISCMLVGASLHGPLVAAEDLLACVDQDIREALLTSPSAGSPAITRDWSPGVPRIALPSVFELIGSRTLRITSVVALQARLPRDTTQAQLDAALAAEGWRALQRVRPARIVGFFVEPRADAFQPSLYCKGDSDFLMAEVTEASAGRSYATLMSFADGHTQRCSLQMRTAPIGPPADVQSDLPALPLPDTVQIISTGHGGGQHDGEAARARVLSKLTTAALLDAIQSELDAQGWRRTSLWHEEHFAGSSWRSADQHHSGVLTLTSLGGEEYDLRFQVISLEE